MGQPLRITFNNTDHTFQIVNTNPISGFTDEFQISIDGKTVTLVKSEGWSQKETEGSIDNGLVQAIGKAIALRYRI